MGNQSKPARTPTADSTGSQPKATRKSTITSIAGKFKPARRSSTLNSTASKSRKPVRRALIIAILYEGENRLLHTHRDAKRWRKFLLDKFHYRAEDVTLMMDEEGTAEHLWPTRDNILRELANLVKDAQDQDRFHFYYSGHSTQRESKSLHEVDGFDEAIMPYKSDIILDDDLRKILVNTLPVGASLTAVFDTCHSGTLLDLDHYACNKVKFPFLEDLLPRQRSSNSTDSETESTSRSPADYVPTAGNGASVTAGDSARPSASGQRTGTRVYRRERRADGVVSQQNVVITEVAPTSKREQRRFTVTRAATLDLARPPAKVRKPRRGWTMHAAGDCIKCIAHATVKTFTNPLDTLKEMRKTRERLLCDGLCKPNRFKTRANVISIAACRDPYQTYETRKGFTMTSAIITVLRREGNSKPKLSNFMADLGTILHKKITQPIRMKNAKALEDYQTAVNEHPTQPIERPYLIPETSLPMLGSLDPLPPDQALEI